METIEIKARRVTGGAIVRVLRDGNERRYHINLNRYNRLRDTLTCHHTGGGSYLRHGFETILTNTHGLNESRKWAARYGNPRAKWWRQTGR